MLEFVGEATFNSSASDDEFIVVAIYPKSSPGVKHKSTKITPAYFVDIRFSHSLTESGTRHRCKSLFIIRASKSPCLASGG